MPQTYFKIMLFVIILGLCIRPGHARRFQEDHGFPAARHQAAARPVWEVSSGSAWTPKVSLNGSGKYLGSGVKKRVAL